MSDNATTAEDPLVQLEIEGGNILDETTSNDIMEYLATEIEEVFGGKERKVMEEDWKKWRRQREARPETRRKSFPWDGASNVVPPIAMQNTNAIYTMLKGSIGVKRPIWTVSTDDRLLLKSAVAWTSLLGILAESPYHLGMRQAQDTILYELASMGTQFVKVPWTVERWNFKRRGTAGIETVSKISKDTPTIEPIALEDFGTRTHWANIQKAPWIAIRNWLYEHELLQRQAQGIYLKDAVDKVLGRSADEITEARAEELRRMGVAPMEGDTKTYAIFEVYLFWDIDGDGIPEDIKVWFDPLSQSILRSEYNELGVRDVVKLVYVPRPNELYGIGVGWMMEYVQDEIEALHNMRVDGTMLSMLQMYVTRRGSGIAPGEDFHPLKNLQVDNPREDFLPVKFPDIGYTTIQAEMMAKEYGDRVTMASDAMMGYESRATSARTTFGGTQFLAGQGAKAFSSIKAGIEMGMSEIGQLTTFQLVANAERSKALLQLLPEAVQPYAAEVLGFDIADIPSTFKFQIQSSSVEQTEDAKRQIKLTLVQLYTQYGKEIFQIVPLIYNPQVPPEVKQIATKFYVGATKLMDNVFESFGEKQSDDYLPYVHDLEVLLDALDAAKEQQIQGAGRRLASGQASGSGNQVQPPPGGGGGGNSFGGVPGMELGSPPTGPGGGIPNGPAPDSGGV